VLVDHHLCKIALNSTGWDGTRAAKSPGIFVPKIFQPHIVYTKTTTPLGSVRPGPHPLGGSSPHSVGIALIMRKHSTIEL
jgi:hypothetical protein